MVEGVDCLVVGCCWVDADAECGGGGCAVFDYLSGLRGGGGRGFRYGGLDQ